MAWIKTHFLRLTVLILLLFYTFSIFYRIDNSFDQDLGRHLKLGEIISETGQVPSINLFSYTHPNFPFINHHYLFEVLIFRSVQAIGLPAILWLKAVLMILAVGLTIMVVPVKNLSLLLPVSFLFLHVLRERTELRPEILSFLFTALTLFILTRFEKTKSRLIYLLPIVQLFWINTHIYFPIGLVIQSIFVLHLGVNGKKHLAKILSIILLSSLVLSLVNPSTIKGLLYPLNIFGNYGYTIAENQTVFLLESLNFKNPNFFFVKAAAFLIILSLLIGAKRRTLTLKNLLLSLAGLSLALVNVRSFPYLVFLSLPAVVENFGTFSGRKVPALLLVLFAPLLIFESALYLNGRYYRQTDTDTAPQLTFAEHGRGALDFLLANNLPQPIFNNFDIGSYIIYRAYPEYKVFVDGRPESYPKEFFKETYIPMQNDPELFKSKVQEYKLKTVVFSHTDQTPWGKNFLNFITKDPEWTTVYLDDFMIILVKNEEAQKRGLPKVELSVLTSDQYSFDHYLSYLRVGLFLLNVQQTQPASAFAQKAFSLNPESSLINLLRGKKTEVPWW